MAEANDAREQRILTAAADLIAHYGYDKTTVEEIAREAGVSKGAIYLHFKSKQDLFEALLLRETEVLTRRFFELIDADPKGLTIFNIYRYGLVILEGSPLMKALSTRDKRVMGDFMRHLSGTPAYGEAVSFSVEAVRYFQTVGLIRADLDASAVTYLMAAVRYGVLTMENFEPGGETPSITLLGETLAEMLASGLAPREGEADPQAARQMLEQLMEMRYKFIEQHKKQER